MKTIVASSNTRAIPRTKNNCGDRTNGHFGAGSLKADTASCLKSRTISRFTNNREYPHREAILSGSAVHTGTTDLLKNKSTFNKRSTFPSLASAPIKCKSAT
jgi:hypothetical protein